MYCMHCEKYTLQSVCSCEEKTAERKPAKYSPEDKWGKYRREVKYTTENI